jgi:hypothetical protein
MSENPTLKEQIDNEATRPRVVAECVTVIDQQVKAKTGIKGVAIRAAYAAIKTIKRRFVPDVVKALLPEWLDKLEPYYQKWSGGEGGSFAEFLVARSEDVAEDMLAVTDARAEKTRHKRAKKYYMKHRDSAKDNVIQAVPDLARLLERHLVAAESSADEAAADSADA